MTDELWREAARKLKPVWRRAMASSVSNRME